MSRLVYQQTDSSPLYSCRSGDCQVMSGIYDPVDVSILYIDSIFMQPYQSHLQMSIPGYIAACYPVQSLLFSTLECFYDQSCINNLTSFISFVSVDQGDDRPYFMALKTSTNNSDNLILNRTIETIVNNLMFESWTTTSISYENYYAAFAHRLLGHIQLLKKMGFLIFLQYFLVSMAV